MFRDTSTRRRRRRNRPALAGGVVFAAGIALAVSSFVPGSLRVSAATQTAICGGDQAQTSSSLKTQLAGALDGEAGCNTTTTTKLSADSVTAGNPVTDTATVTISPGGGIIPSAPKTIAINTGTVTFTIYSGTGKDVCTDGNLVTTLGPVNVVNGTATGDPVTLDAGSYEVVATYSGATPLKTSHSACGDEPLTVTKADPTLATTRSQSVNIGGTISDVASISNGFHPGDSPATVSWGLFGPFATGTPISPSTCDKAHDLTGSLASGFSSHVADAKDTTSATYDSPTFTPKAAGQYVWIAHYSGNADNTSQDGACTDMNETVPVTAPNSSLVKSERDLGAGAGAAADPATPSYVASITSALANDVIQYELVYFNSGNGDATGVAVGDTAPTGTTLLASSCLAATGWVCNVASGTATFTHAAAIPGGTSDLAVGTFKVTINSGTTAFTNVGTVTSTQETSPTFSNNALVLGVTTPSAAVSGTTVTPTPTPTPSPTPSGAVSGIAVTAPAAAAPVTTPSTGADVPFGLGVLLMLAGAGMTAVARRRPRRVNPPAMWSLAAIAIEPPPVTLGRTGTFTRTDPGRRTMRPRLRFVLPLTLVLMTIMRLGRRGLR